MADKYLSAAGKRRRLYINTIKAFNELMANICRQKLVRIILVTLRNVSQNQQPFEYTDKALPECGYRDGASKVKRQSFRLASSPLKLSAARSV